MEQQLREDGTKIPDLPDAIQPLFALESHLASPLIMMSAVSGDSLDLNAEASCRRATDKQWPHTPPIHGIDRTESYDTTKKAFAVLKPGETPRYGNIILKRCDPAIWKIGTLAIMGETR
jgi:L-fucose mutarotase